MCSLIHIRRKKNRLGFVFGNKYILIINLIGNIVVIIIIVFN